MKKISLKIFIVFILMLSLTSCIGEKNIIIALEEESITMEEGTEKQLAFDILVEKTVIGSVTTTQKTNEFEVSYSTDSDVITVSDDGTIYAVKTGTAILTLTINDENKTTTTINITVIDNEITKELVFQLNSDGTGYIVSGVTSELDTDIVVPSEYRGLPVVEIGVHAFYGCSDLTSVIISENVKKIGSQSFYGCSGLIDLVIPDGVIEISQSAFIGCSSLENITLPSSLEKIGSSSFIYCINLESVYYTGTIEQWCNIGFVSNSSSPMFHAKKNIYVE